MTFPNESTANCTLPSRIMRSILASIKHSKNFNRAYSIRSISLSVALVLLVTGFILLPSMHPFINSLVRADESIATFASADCTTPKSTWNLGETACAVATDAPSDRRIAWVAPNGNTAQVSSSTTGGTFSDSYHIPTGSDPFAQVGTWTVQTIDANGAANTSAQFVVRDPNNTNADLAIGNFGPFQTSAGSNINYTIEVINHGPDDAQVVTITDSIPGNTTFVSEVQNSGPSFTCVTPLVGSGTGSITCTIATLPVNAVAVFTVAFNVNSGTPSDTVITNSATISSTTTEPRPADNSASTSATVVATSTVCSLNCPSNITQDNDPNQCSAVVNYSTPTTSGNCGSPPDNAVTCNPTSGSTFPVGSTVVTCSTQSGGDCSFTVTVHDTRSPVQPTISCPPNQTSSEDSPGSGSAVVNYPPPTTTGNCVTTVCNPPSGSAFSVGTTTVNCTATDSANNMVSCSFTVTVTSGAACTLTCPGDVTQTAPSGQCSAVVTYANPATSGNCGTVTCDPPSGSTFQSGTTLVTCTSSQGPSCSFTVTVNAPAPPTITTCASNRTISVDANCEAALPNMVGEVQTTGCSVTVSQSPAAGTIVGPGTYTVTFTAENSAGQATCTATVTASDTTPPVISTCPAPTSAAADSHCQAPVPDVTGGVTASDNCTPAASLTVTQNPAAGTLVGVGTTTITITVRDAANNAATCTTTFTVNDTTRPTAVCKDITVALDANGNASITGADVDGGSTDNCGITSRTVTPNTFTCANKGPNTVTLTVKDASNNSASCQATVTVVDNTPPTITCPANQTKSTDPNQCSAVVTYSNATATDNCPGVGTPSCTPPSGSTFPKGTTPVTCTVSDASNNSASCTFTVTVNDTQPPTITCPANQTRSTDPNQCSAVVSYPAPAVSDNCPGATAVCSPPSGSTFPKGTTAVTCTATDTSNNSSSCSFTVTVVDTQPPSITCPANIVKEPTCPAGAVVTYPAPVVSDNCPGVTFACSPASGSTFAIGTTTVTCTATDTSNNTAQCSFTVHVKSPAEVIQDLINRVQALINQGVLSNANGQSLINRLQSALDYLNAGTIDKACDKLADFIQKTQNFIDNGTLTSAQGQPLIDSANRVRNTLACNNTSGVCT
jgi:uncharacterized repeat protein (TIGR01451 family)